LRYFRVNLSIGSLGLEEEFVAEQATDTVDGAGAVAGTGAAGTVGVPGIEQFPHNPGRRISWAGTITVIIGFIIGGIAFFPSPNWLVFWIGTGVAIVGCLILAFSKTMNTDWY
jgi:hypothetical protein